MINSMVLKDMAQKPAGYVRQSGRDIICRASLELCAGLAVVFEDGTQAMYALDAGTREQSFRCDGKRMSGCYVFAKEELLLVSHQEMREAFCRQALRRSEQEQRKNLRKIDNLQEKPQPMKPSDSALYRLAQRRWPPPPCWDTARYQAGDWQEEEMRRP